MDGAHCRPLAARNELNSVIYGEGSLEGSLQSSSSKNERGCEVSDGRNNCR